MVVELSYGPYRVRNIEGTREWELVEADEDYVLETLVRTVPDMGYGRIVWAKAGRPTTLEDAASYAAALQKLITLTMIDDDMAAVGM